jgi:prepilin-type N-terminal cleavage/methylation domain-containing protein
MSSISQNKRSTSQDSSAGFTLLEVLVAIFILTFISLGIFQATTQTYGLRQTLSEEGDFYNEIRLSMNIVQRDVTSLYSPIYVDPKYNPTPTASSSPPPFTQQTSNPANPVDPTLAQTYDYWEPAIDSMGVRPSRFVGTEKKISFVANSHVRVYKETPESEFSTITYDLAKDDTNPELQMLVKTESTDAFTLDPRHADPYIRTYALLHGIKKFAYRFYRKDKDEWGPKWDTDIDEFKNIYPDIVELTVEALGPHKMLFDGRYLFKPELPLRAIDPSR